MNITQVLKKPLLTEKSNTMKADENIVCFEVDKRANKMQIKEAVEKMFGVKVEAVTTHGRSWKTPPLRPFGRNEVRLEKSIRQSERRRKED